MELKAACEPCSCCQEEKGVTLTIITTKGTYCYERIREWELSTFIDYYKRTMELDEVQIKY